MTNEMHTPDPAAEGTAPRVPRTRFARGVLAATVAVLGLGAIGAGLAAAQDARILHGDGPRAELRAAHFGARGGGMGAFMEWRLERTLEALDASPDQVEAVKAIAAEARDEIAPIVAEFRGTREALAEILEGDTIDREAAEALRAERLAAMDAASARGLEALLDAAEVLSPAQRAELADKMEERRRGWGRW